MTLAEAVRHGEKATCVGRDMSQVNHIGIKQCVVTWV